MKSTTLSIRFLAALALLGAGTIHTFPTIWRSWDTYVQTNPGTHYQIGAVAFVLGITNLILLIQETIVILRRPTPPLTPHPHELSK